MIAQAISLYAGAIVLGWFAWSSQTPGRRRGPVAAVIIGSCILSVLAVSIVRGDLLKARDPIDADSAETGGCPASRAC